MTAFFNKYSEESIEKLELFESYLEKWLPVFLHSRNKAGKLIFPRINILDYFCGPGGDDAGQFGSPFRAIDVIRSYLDQINESEITLYLNDQNHLHIETLEKRLAQFGVPDKITVVTSNKGFSELFAEHEKMLHSKECANFIFLDQFGISEVTKDIFARLRSIRTTDILFFVSSSIFKRFYKDKNITDIIDADQKDVAKISSQDIHRYVVEQYSSQISEGEEYYLAPYSIKKKNSGNVYGLIFGSKHPLGMEKFLQSAWKRDGTTGEANFDLYGDVEKGDQMSFFSEFVHEKKVDKFAKELRAAVLSKELKTDADIYLYSLKKGFINMHIQIVMKDLVSSGRIESTKGYKFTYQSIKSGYKPRSIIIR